MLSERNVTALTPDASTIGQGGESLSRVRDEPPAWEAWQVVAWILAYYLVGALLPKEGGVYAPLWHVGLFVFPLAYIAVSLQQPLANLGWTTKRVGAAFKDGAIASIIWFVFFGGLAILPGVTRAVVLYGAREMPAIVRALGIPAFGTFFGLGRIGATLLVSVSEETVFLGLLYPPLRHKWGVYMGAVATAALFSVFHGADGGLNAFALHLVAIFLYRRRDSLVGPVLFHWVTLLLVPIMLAYWNGLHLLMFR